MRRIGEKHGSIGERHGRKVEANGCIIERHGRPFEGCKALKNKKSYFSYVFIIISQA